MSVCDSQITPSLSSQGKLNKLIRCELSAVIRYGLQPAAFPGAVQVPACTEKFLQHRLWDSFRIDAVEVVAPA